MIRVNLLPQKRESRSEGGQGWLLAVAAVVVVEVVGLLLFHNMKLGELATQKQKNRELQDSIDQIKKTVANHTEIKGQLEALRAREEAISKLQDARTGPTAVFLELARMLTKGQLPTYESDEKVAQLVRDNPQAVPQKGWDAERLWLLSYEETDRVVKLKGLARDADDVAELSRRLTLSRYFSDVRMLSGANQPDATTKIDLKAFELIAKARY